MYTNTNISGFLSWGGKAVRAWTWKQIFILPLPSVQTSRNSLWPRILAAPPIYCCCGPSVKQWLMMKEKKLNGKEIRTETWVLKRACPSFLLAILLPPLKLLSSAPRTDLDQVISQLWIVHKWDGYLFTDWFLSLNYNLYDTDFSRYFRVVTEFSDSFGPVCTNSWKGHKVTQCNYIHLNIFHLSSVQDPQSSAFEHPKLHPWPSSMPNSLEIISIVLLDM